MYCEEFPVYFTINLEYNSIFEDEYQITCFLYCHSHTEQGLQMLCKWRNLIKPRNDFILEQDYIKNFNSQNITQKINKALLLL